MNSIFFKISRLAKLLFCIYFVLFFALVIPFHHHADNKTHEKDCSICMLAAQQFISEVNSGITAVFVFIIAVFIAKNAIKKFKKDAIYLRSPPTL